MRTNSWIPAVFNDIFNTDFMPKASATAPAINVKETDKAYFVELAAPGMKKEEHKDEDKSARYLRREFSYSKFEQTLILPDDVKKDDIKARVEHGVLTVELPKEVEEKVKVSRQIEIG